MPKRKNPQPKEQWESKYGVTTLIHNSLEQRERFLHLKDREYSQQRFVDIPTLQELGVYDGVHRLFSNIGWEKLLTLEPMESYKNTTIEFLQSLEFNDNAKCLSFRLMRLQFKLSLDDLSGFVGISKFNTYGPKLGYMREKNNLFKAQAKAFWKEITGLDVYEARSAKASHIIHPVLRVALRIIANLVFPQEDVSRAGKMELEILWCMVTGLKRPHFGAFLASKLLKVSTSDSGPIHCGGIISYLATRLACAELFESKRPDLEKITQGTNTITSNVLVASSFFRQEGDGSITWLVQGEPYLRVPTGDFSTLQLQ